jgi:L-alanine-DL-glutamate epimerase-like enolase superfamily enzyme
MELSFERVVRRFAAAQSTAHGVLEARESIEVTLVDFDGAFGRGEAAPLASFDTVSIERAVEALEAYRGALERADAGGARDACAAADPLPQALAAIDVALWDLAGRRAGTPIAALLASTPADSVEVNASVADVLDADAASAAAAAVAAGYRTIKLKVGTGDDLARIRAVRAAIGPEVALRLDANGAWSRAEAERVLNGAGPLELVEEPVRGPGELAALRGRVAVRLAVDESAGEGADAVALKLSRSGGISGLLADAARARAAGMDVYVTSTYEGPIGVAAALHAAAALAPLPACGLATLELFEAPSPLPVRDGRIAVPRGPGLGI